MALELKVKIDSEQEDASYFTVVDDTGFFSVAEETYNPTGYSNTSQELIDNPDNPMRAGLFVTLLVERVYGSKKYIVPVAVYPNTDTPANADTWRVTSDKDGFYSLLLIAAYEWVTSQTYIVDNVRYANGKFYKCVGEHDSDLIDELEDATLWKEIVNISDFPADTETAGAYSDTLPHLVKGHTEICKVNKTIAFAEKGADDASAEDMAQNFIWTEIQYLASLYSAGFGDYVEAGKFIIEASDTCSSTSNCGC